MSQGLWNEVRMGVMLMDRRAIGRSNPYLASRSTIRNLGPIQSPEHHHKHWGLKILVADAKARIAIYGGKPVVESLAGFLGESGCVIDTPASAKAFMAICQLMRRDSHPSPGSVSDPDMHLLVFGMDMDACEP